MDTQDGSTHRPRYRWPWFLLAAVILGVVLAIVWMTAAIREVQEQRDPMYPGPRPSATPASGTNARVPESIRDALPGEVRS
jgi:hypothetical protein